jgi:hypothetical protein
MRWRGCSCGGSVETIQRVKKDGMARNRKLWMNRKLGEGNGGVNTEV